MTPAEIGLILLGLIAVTILFTRIIGPLFAKKDPNDPPTGSYGER